MWGYPVWFGTQVPKKPLLSDWLSRTDFLQYSKQMRFWNWSPTFSLPSLLFNTYSLKSPNLYFSSVGGKIIFENYSECLDTAPTNLLIALCKAIVNAREHMIPSCPLSVCLSWSYYLWLVYLSRQLWLGILAYACTLSSCKAEMGWLQVWGQSKLHRVF